jgi:four helix bundle protein
MTREPAKSFQDLIVWQKAHQFVLSTYGFSSDFPKTEVYGLTSAEGFKKRGSADKLRFLNISEGSLEECRYYLILAKDLNYGETETLMTQLEEVSRLLIGYSKSILNSL